MLAHTAVTGGSVTHALQGPAVMVRNQEQDPKEKADPCRDLFHSAFRRVNTNLKTKIYRAGERERPIVVAESP